MHRVTSSWGIVFRIASPATVFARFSDYESKKVIAATEVIFEKTNHEGVGMLEKSWTRKQNDIQE